MCLELKNLYSNFRDSKTIQAYQQLIEKESKKLKKDINIMEVCGGHTHSIMKYGLNQLLPSNINFLHGPGCPVCVMPKEIIDYAYTIAMQKDVILTTLGDMIKVVGSNGSLQDARSKGADVRFVYSPLEILKIANKNLDKQVVFFAIGFETTTPMSSVLIEQIIKKDVKNIKLFINHITIPNAMKTLLEDNDNKIDAFLGPSHVSVISGSKIYDNISKNYNKPIVISGFEPVDVMESIYMILKQINEKQYLTQNQYSRSVNYNGNLKAQKLNSKFFKVVDFNFRGLGIIPNSGLALKDEFSYLDAKKYYQSILNSTTKEEHKLCLCTEILKGKARPDQCKLFRTLCTPQNPIGSCMVSSEGACSAYFKYSNLL
jgi:hydrogenase expression/formation protein HypD